MQVPNLAGDEDLHEPHAALDESAGDQAAACRIRACRVGRGRTSSCVARRLLRDVEGLFRGRLHAGGQLVAGDAGLEIGLAGMPLEVPAIEPAEKLEVLLLQAGL